MINFNNLFPFNDTSVTLPAVNTLRPPRPIIKVKLLNKLERFQKRDHRLICGADCKCNGFEPIVTRFHKACIKFFLCVKKNFDKHPLHGLIPQAQGVPHISVEWRKD